jgi:hypothetical protein
MKVYISIIYKSVKQTFYRFHLLPNFVIKNIYICPNFIKFIKFYNIRNRNRINLQKKII